MLIFLLAMGSSLAVVQAAHFLPQTGAPRCTVTLTTNPDGSISTTVSCTGTLAGLGNGDLLITTSVSGFALYTCENKGGNQAAGINKVLEGPSVTPTPISGDEIKNGRLTFTTDPNTLTADPTVSGATAGCPNGNWTGVDPQVTATGITLTVDQPVGTRILTCTATNSAGFSTGTFQFTTCTFP
jgi:hypothetical protein